MNYSDEPGHCRVDFFKPSGKWYDTIVVDFTGLYDEPVIHNALKKALIKSVGNHYKEMQAVCLEPYHKHEHPVSLIWKGVDIK